MARSGAMRGPNLCIPKLWGQWCHGGAWELVGGPSPYVCEWQQDTFPLWSPVTSLCCGSWWSITDTSLLILCPQSVEG